MQEKILNQKKNGMLALILIILSYLLAIGGLVIFASSSTVLLMVVCILWLSIGWISLLGLKILKPQEALVLTLFGKYIGTLKEEGFYYVNPFCSSVNPASKTKLKQSGDVDATNNTGITIGSIGGHANVEANNKRISLKIMTLSNNKQKINDCLGNPIEIGIAVTWKVVDTAKAVFAVDNFKEYLSLQCDSALRNIVRTYPYDVANNIDTTGDGVADDGSLRGSSELVALKIKEEIQSKVAEAGLDILEARITYLAYAPEIAAVMLQRQQASAIIDARKMIVDGAVGMVEMALDKLNENKVVELDEERKAAMVSNLLVVLCGNHDAQPIVNSGSLY
ncbi:Somatin-like protein [Acetoanaerobium sticklandii]|uniref:Somatin-like protein n=1 Tax=Acetoanaerobium sticklandii (strain ATCC 12662 / DSM 519 / JCM 1433 / CCUG 9281 / NCIMB 10654 / HF) TaxID=499177 RepID=E3PTS3_ACESD|nr:SPFH domain-containing protein [Acetoanaerobium sticklandii]CBH22277.1 Somatin-like protein [Acetoanaerobium sticklandii]